MEDTAVLALMHLIKSRLERRGLEGFDNSVGLPIEWLAQEPLASILQTVRILGTQYLNVHGRPLDDDFTLAEAAATCLADWPRNYARFLAGLRAKTVQADPKRTGLLRYEPFYSAMFRNRPAAETSFLLEEFRRFEDSAPLDSVQAPSVESTAIDTVRGTFARRFKVGPAREVSWTDIDHEATCSATVRAVSPRDASRYLGLPVSVLAVLRRSGVFAATVPLEASASWHVEDVEDFAERVARLPMVRPLEAGIVELTRVMARKISVATKTALVTAILDGRVAVYARIGLGFAGLRLDLDGVSAVLAANVGEKSRGTCTLPAAAARLSLCQSVIPAAIAAGLVDSIDVDGSQRVTNSSLEKFEKSYVSLALLARRLKTTPRPLLRMAAELSITVTKLQRPAHPSPQGIIRKVDEARLTASLVADRRKTPRRSAAETTTKSLKTYLGRLRKRGKDLPRCGQSPNMRAIAAACGFDRSVFTRYPSTNDLVMAFDIAARQDRGIVAPCDALRTYLGELRSRGEPLPVRNGRPNVLAIARACGVDRTRFYDDHSLRDLLEAAAIA